MSKLIEVTTGMAKKKKKKKPTTGVLHMHGERKMTVLTNCN